MTIVSGVTIAQQCSFQIIDCDRCGTLFAITEEMVRRRRNDGQSFYCPNGHEMCYSETELKRTQRELAQLKAKRDQLEASLESERSRMKIVERSRIALKGQITKIKKKIGHGECPCCNGVFRNLRRHMQRQHPDFADEATTEETPETGN